MKTFEIILRAIGYTLAFQCGGFKAIIAAVLIEMAHNADRHPYK